MDLSLLSVRSLKTRDHGAGLGWALVRALFLLHLEPSYPQVVSYQGKTPLMRALPRDLMTS